MTLGICLPQLGQHVDANLVRDFAQAAEDMGFADLYVQDHFLFALHQDGVYGGSAPRQPLFYQTVYAPTEMLGWVAAHTSTIKLGTSVLVAGYHWPAQLANRLATLDRLSAGRLATVGLGVGWSHEEHHAVGVDPRSRGRRIEDFVPALLACWGSDPVEYHGPFFDIPASLMRPKPVGKSRPRLMSGMFSTAGIRRTADLFDLWNPGSVAVDRVSDIVAGINERREGRAPLGVAYRVALENTAGERTSLEKVVERVEQSARAGFETVIIETNFCSDIQSAEDWMRKLQSLQPVLNACQCSSDEKR